jgi:hypothetical protein
MTYWSRLTPRTGTNDPSKYNCPSSSPTSLQIGRKLLRTFARGAKPRRQAVRVSSRRPRRAPPLPPSTVSAAAAATSPFPPRAAAHRILSLQVPPAPPPPQRRRDARPRAPAPHPPAAPDATLRPPRHPAPPPPFDGELLGRELPGPAGWPFGQFFSFFNFSFKLRYEIFHYLYIYIIHRNLKT